MNRFTSAVCTALFVMFAATAQAAAITYSFDGTGTGTLDGVAFDAPFVVLIHADTGDAAFQPSLNAVGILNLSGSISVGGEGTANFTLPLFVFGGNGADSFGFGNLTQGNLIAIFQNGLGLAAWDLISNFGPAAGTNSNLNQFHDVATDLGILTFRSMSDVTFAATLDEEVPVPEPAALLLMGAGLAFVAVRMRRFTARG